MNKSHIVVSNVTVEMDPELSLDELCALCEISTDFIRELIEYGALDCDEGSLET